MTRDLSELVKFLVDAACNHISLAQGSRCLRMHCPAQIIQKFRTSGHIVEQIVQSLDTLAPAQSDDRVGLAQSPAKLHDFARHDLTGCCAGNYTFKVSDIADHPLQVIQSTLIINKILNNIIPCFKLLDIHHRHRKPCTEHTRAHRRRALVHDLDQRSSLSSCCRCKYFKITESKAVHPYEGPFIDARNRADIAQISVLCMLQIDKERTCRCHSEREIIDGKSLERIHLELPLEPFHRAVVHECPILESGYVETVAVSLLSPFLIAPRHKKLLRRK